MIVLVINSGSSSLKYELFNLNDERSLFSGAVTRIGLDGAEHRYICAGEETVSSIEVPDHLAAIEQVLQAVTAAENCPVHDLTSIGAVAHRVGHGGLEYRSPVVIDEDVKAVIKKKAPIMPLHHPAMLAGIEACEQALPGIPHVAVFDTAFHSAIPDEAAIYGLPHAYFTRGIRKFGFHGNSHEYVAHKATAYLETPLRRLNIVSCHLGNGASVCAIERGHSIDTSMGFSPLQGLLMGTRAGDVDPGVLTYLLRNEGLGADELDRVLNSESGLLGISGVSSDMRDVLAAADEGNQRALLAVKVFCYRVKHYIGAYTAVLGGADVLIFTGGIGEHAANERARCVQGLEKVGFAIDPLRNERCLVTAESPVCEISASYSRATILVIATNEELMMARHCARAIDYQSAIKEDLYTKDKRAIRVAVSVRHVHLSRADVEALFGEGHRLTKQGLLYLGTSYAAEETVSLIGLRARIDNVRVIGPEREQTQVEISRTEEFKLGIDAPIRESGDLKGSPGITIEGPKGRITIPEGVICAMRHIHMSPEDAVLYGVQDRDIVMVKIKGERELIFGDVLVRVADGVKTEMHLDTDEANAAQLPPVAEGYLVRIESRE